MVDGSMSWCSVVSGLVEDLLVGRWSVVCCWWSVGRWSTCRWIGGRWSVVGWSLEDLLVDRWSVVHGSAEDLSVGRWSVVVGFVIRLSKHVKVSEFFTSEERSSSNFGNLMIDENFVREEHQPSISSQNQTETTTEPKQSSFDGHNSDIISTNEVRVNYIFTFFSILFAT